MRIKKIDTIKKETLYEPFENDKYENIGVYFDRIVDKARPSLFWLWVLTFISYMFSFENILDNMF